jgi:hypothetical protein
VLENVPRVDVMTWAKLDAVELSCVAPIDTASVIAEATREFGTKPASISRPR